MHNRCMAMVLLCECYQRWDDARRGGRIAVQEPLAHAIVVVWDMSQKSSRGRTFACCCVIFAEALILYMVQVKDCKHCI